MADKKITDLPSAPEAHSADLLIADQDKGGGALETRKLALGQVRQWLQSLFDGRFLRQSKNLSDLTSVSDARTNLDLGTAATKNVGTGNGDVPQNKDLGTAATKNVGTGNGDVPQNKDLGTAATKNTDTSATPDTVPLRDADGRIKAAVPSANDDVVNLLYLKERIAPTERLVRPLGYSDFTVFVKTGHSSIAITAGTYGYVGGKYIYFENQTAINIPALTGGEDYSIWLNPNGNLEAVHDPFESPASPPESGAVKLGGFHYSFVPTDATMANGSFATSGPGMHWTQNDIDKIKGINEFTFWDLLFNDGYDNRGFSLDPNYKSWQAIYYVNDDTDSYGLSRAGRPVASGTVAAKIPVAYGGDGSAKYTARGGLDGPGNWYDLHEVCMSQGGRFPNDYEFYSYAYGTTEQSTLGGSSATIPETKREPGYTSRIGIEQVSGHQYIWGLQASFREDGSGADWYDKNGGRGQTYMRKSNGLVRVRLGGARDSPAERCGSRAANWRDSPWYSDWHYSARAARDLVDLRRER